MKRLSLLFFACGAYGKVSSLNLNDMVKRQKTREEKNVVLIKFNDDSTHCRQLLAQQSLTSEEPSVENLRKGVFYPFVEDTLKTKFGFIADADKVSEAPIDVKVVKYSSVLEDVTEFQLTTVPVHLSDGIHTPEAQVPTKQKLTFRWLKNVHQEAIEVPAVINSDKLVKHLKSSSCIKFAAKTPKAAPLYIMQDPLASAQWWVGEVGAEDGKFAAAIGEAHKIWQGGDVNFTVGVLDTGCDLEHPDMYKFGEYDQFAFNSQEAGGDTWQDYSNRRCKNNRDDDRNGVRDDCFGVNWDSMSGDAWDFVGHGTHVASIVAGATNNKRYTASTCPSCKVLCMMPLGHVTRSINYAIDRNVTVMNWSGSYFRDGLSDDFKEIISDSLKSYEAKVDGLWVCAAGNHPVDLDMCLPHHTSVNGTGASSPLKKGDEQRGGVPAICNGYDDSVIRQDYHFGFPCELSVSLPNILCVGASDIKGNNAYFSTYGKKTVNVFAPGKDILAHFPVYMGNLVRILSGTSMASPVVAGIAGLIRSKYPTLSAAETRTIIEQSCSKSDALAEMTKCGGIINAAVALKIAETLVALTPTIVPSVTTPPTEAATETV